MALKDYNNQNFSLENFIPENLRSKTVSALVKNLFNRHLTKEETIPFFGYVGIKNSDPFDLTPRIANRSPERAINNLIPMIKGSVGSEDFVFSFSDILNKARDIGIDTTQFHKWGAAQSFNFAPPIDFDKFTNFKNYYWYAQAVENCSVGEWNTDLQPEYYVIASPKNDDIVKYNCDLKASSNIDLSYVAEYKDEVWEVLFSDKFSATIVGSNNLAEVFTITRAVGESSWTFTSPRINFIIKRGSHDFIAGDKITVSIKYVVSDVSISYNLTGGNGSLYGVSSSVELRSIGGTQLKINDRVLLINQSNASENGIYEVRADGFKRPADFDTWSDIKNGAVVSIDNETYSLISTGLNISDSTPLTNINLIFEQIPFQYNISDWVKSNKWIHKSDVSTLNIKDKSKLIQAYRPIIEYSLGLEMNNGVSDGFPSPGINAIQYKSDFNQVPLFNQYLPDGTHTRSVGGIFTYAIDENASLDKHLQLRVKKDPSTLDFIFEQSLIGKNDAILYFKENGQLKSIWRPGKAINEQPEWFEQLTFANTTSIISISEFGDRVTSDTIELTTVSETEVKVETKNLGVLAENMLAGTEITIPGYFKLSVGVLSNVILGEKCVLKIQACEKPRYVYVNNDVTVDFIPGESNDVDKVGTWLNPKQLKQNIAHENKKELILGDLTGHFRSVMGEQPGFVGSLNGSNNFRTISDVNLGFGGIIKNYNFDYNLFMSIMLQDTVSVSSILNFSLSQYDQNLLSINEYFRKNFSNFINTHGYDFDNVISGASNEYVDLWIADYENYYSERLDLAAFNSSTMPISNWAPTLPHLGIVPKVLPSVVFEQVSGTYKIRHHDGHLTDLISPDVDFDYFLTINAGTKGVVEENVSSPVSKTIVRDMLWFNPSTSELKIFNVISEGIDPLMILDAQDGDIAYFNNQTWQFNSGVWTSVAISSAWKNVSTSNLLSSIILRIENRIFDAILDEKPILFSADEYNAISEEDFEMEFAKFGAKYNIDVTATDFDINNPWTWNYKSADFSSVSPSLNGIARWSKLYEAYLGTARPILFPWAINGLTSTTDIEQFKDDWATQFFDRANNSLVSLSDSDRGSIDIDFVIDEEIDLQNCPSIIQGVDVNVNDIILLTSQTDLAENGIYNVSATAIWTKHSSYDSTAEFSNGTWFAVKNGRYANSIWVVTNEIIRKTEQYRLWKKEMWETAFAGKKVCVNPYVETMLPPYVSSDFEYSSYALTNVVPSGIDSTYVFGDFGPAEELFYRSIEFNYAVSHCLFLSNPISFLMKTWGNIFITAPDKNLLDAETNTKISHFDIVLHGETIENLTSRNSDIIQGDLIDFAGNSAEMKVIDFINGTPVFSFTAGNWTLLYSSSDVFNNCNFSDGINRNFFVDKQGYGFVLGDKINFNINDAGQITDFVFTNSETETFIGINQLYAQLLNFNNIDLYNSFDNVFLREWDVKFGYRFDSVVKSEQMVIKSGEYEIPNTMREIHLKNTPKTRSLWLQALRVELVSTGLYIENEFGKPIPPANGDDWVFKIHGYNIGNPSIEYFEYDTSAEYETFIPLNEPQFKTWKKFKNVIGTKTVTLPIIVTGVQNVLNVLFGYADKMEADGWRFNRGVEGLIDPEINRAITWFSQIEKFVYYVFKSLNVGEGAVINPFMSSVWFETERGIVSKIDSKKFVDINNTAAFYDILGDVIDIDNVNIIRDEGITEISSIVPLFSGHIFIDEFEHVVLFNNYIDTSNKFTLIFDPFLGISVPRLHFNGEAQSVQNGRPVLGGHYILNSKTYKNVMNQVDDMAHYYDVDVVHKKSKDIAKNSLALLGFNKKDYFDDLNISDVTQLNFWRALVKTKGTNLNIDAYLNNNKFKTAFIDEYWAYKVAEYGDVRTKEFPELNLRVSDAQNTISMFNFITPGETVTSNPGIINIVNDDMDRWNYTNLFDQTSTQDFLFMSPDGSYEFGIDNYLELSNEQREKLEKRLNKHFFFSAEKIFELPDLKYHFENYELVQNDENIFELPKLCAVADLIVLTKIDKFTKEIFRLEVSDYLEKINNETLKVIQDSFWDNGSSNFAYSLSFYGIKKDKYNTAKIIDKVSNSTIDTVSLWHPAADINEARAMLNVNFKSEYNPAKYQYVPNNTHDVTYSPTMSWGPEQVGSVWWDTSNLSYVPYYDVTRFPSLQDRLSRWGALANWSTVDVYEWIESSVPPTEYNAVAAVQETDFSIDESIRLTGVAALETYHQKQRVWSSRPVAWSFKQDGGSTDIPTFTKFADARVIIENLGMGESNVIFDNISYSEVEYIQPDVMLCGWGNPGWNVDDRNVPVGQFKFTNSVKELIGRDISNEDFENGFLIDAIRQFKSRTSTSGSEYFSEVKIEPIDINKPINTLGKIDFRLDGAIYNDTFVINYPNSLTNGTQKFANTQLLTLSLIEIGSSENGGNRVLEKISVDSSYYISSNQNVEFEFRKSNIKLTFVFNENYEFEGIQQLTANVETFWDIFGGICSISKTALQQLPQSNLQNIVNALQIIPGEFGTNGDVYIRKSFSGTILSPFNQNIYSNMTSSGSTDVIYENAFGWVMFNQPTQDELNGDEKYPLNKWTPFIGNEVQISSYIVSYDYDGTSYQMVTTDKPILDIILEYSKTPLIANSVEIKPYVFEWSNWRKLNEYMTSKTLSAQTTEVVFEFGNTSIDKNLITIYVNGIIQPFTSYSKNSENSIVFSSSNLRIGDVVTLRGTFNMPSSSELAFNPDVDDNIEKQNWFKIDYPYSYRVVRNETGSIISTNYYFWVKNKTTKSVSKSMSIDRVSQLLQYGPRTYLTFQNIIDESENIEIMDGVNVKLPTRYQTMTINGLDMFVKRNDVYVLQFVKDFSFRTDPNGLDLKNKHTEWTLIRKGMTNRRIPKQLWEKFVDSACGQDDDGNYLPSANRSDYDKYYNTSTRYGFSSDQILCDSEILVKSIKYIIENSTLTRSIQDGFMPDRMEFIDYNNIDGYFISASKTRETLNMIWEKAKPAHINEIFFFCLDDIVAANKEMTHLFKTSRLSAYSLRTINQVISSGIVYDT